MSVLKSAEPCIIGRLANKESRAEEIRGCATSILFPRNLPDNGFRGNFSHILKLIWFDFKSWAGDVKGGWSVVCLIVSAYLLLVMNGGIFF